MYVGHENKRLGRSEGKVRESKANSRRAERLDPPPDRADVLDVSLYVHIVN